MTDSRGKKCIVKDGKNEACIREDGAAGETSGHQERRRTHGRPVREMQHSENEGYGRICKLTSCRSWSSPVRRKEQQPT